MTSQQPDRTPELTPQQIRMIAVGHATEIISSAARANRVTAGQLLGFAERIAEYITDGTIQ